MSSQTNGFEATAKVTQGVEDTAGLCNLFEYLDVEEPAEWTAGVMPPKTKKVTDTYELKSTDEDISFAIFCLLKDLTDIRHYVQQTVSMTGYLHVFFLCYLSAS